jgi:hypothetical protein
MRNKNGNAVSNRNGERNSPLRRKMAIRFTSAKKSFPSSTMSQHVCPVNLPANHETTSVRRKSLLKTRPPRHYFAGGICP